MKELDNILPKVNVFVTKSVTYISKHRTVITVVVACGAILASVLQAQVYLNPVRNENKYNEQKSSAGVKTINKEIVNKLEATQNDGDISVDSNFVPDRNNPFTE